MFRFCIILSISVSALIEPPSSSSSPKHDDRSEIYFGMSHSVALKVVFGMLMALVALLALFLWITRGYARSSAMSSTQLQSQSDATHVYGKSYKCLDVTLTQTKPLHNNRQKIQNYVMHNK